MHRNNAPIRAAIMAGLAVAVVALSATGFSSPASADSGRPAVEAKNVSLTWGLDDEASAGAFFGGCNFLSAGTAGNNGSSKVWTVTAPRPGYASRAGNVTILKPDLKGHYARPTFDTKCKGPDGTTDLTTTTTSGTQVRFDNGHGVVDPAHNTAIIRWSGSFTSVFYGGLVYWSGADPTLTIHHDGTGTLVARLSGFGASPTDPSVWNPLPRTTVTLATLTRVKVTRNGFSVAPDYRKVAVRTASDASPQTRTGPFWGSFPQSFVNFQNRTGESSFWYSSGLDDQSKVASRIAVGYAVPRGDHSHHA